jgi:MarR family transcriptional regulator, transcriptional regulator for hemolysin
MPGTQALTRFVSTGGREKLETAVAFNVVLTGRLWRARFTDRMRALDQTDARWTALAAIAAAAEGMTQTKLADRLGIQGPTLVRLLDALEKQGLVARRSAPSDRRANLISIEPKGREILHALNGFAARMRDEFFAAVSDADLQTTLGVLRHLALQLGPIDLVQ